MSGSVSTVSADSTAQSRAQCLVRRVNSVRRLGELLFWWGLGAFAACCGVYSPGCESHSDTTLYLSFVIIDTKYTGWRQGDFNLHAARELRPDCVEGFYLLIPLTAHHIKRVMSLAPRPGAYWSLFGPLALTLLMTCVSVDLMEARQLENKGEAWEHYAEQVRKTPSWPCSWANFSLLSQYSHRKALANLHLFGPTKHLSRCR